MEENINQNITESCVDEIDKIDEIDEIDKIDEIDEIDCKYVCYLLKSTVCNRCLKEDQRMWEKYYDDDSGDDEGGMFVVVEE